MTRMVPSSPWAERRPSLGWDDIMMQPYYDVGVVYVFVRSGGTWTNNGAPTAVLTPSFYLGYEHLGASV